MNQFSYCLIGDRLAVAGVDDHDKAVPILSGLWQWQAAFKKYGNDGDVRLVRSKDELEEYDIIHINMSAGNLALPQMVAEELKDSDTKLVVNVDFDVMQWGANWQYPTLLLKAVDCADMVFHVESTGAKILEHVLKRRVHTLPHPVDVVGLDQYKKTEREPTIVTMWHRYIQDCTLPYFAQKDIPLYKILLGYGGRVPTLAMYDIARKPQPFVDAIETMSLATFGCDLYPGRTYGRSVVEFAALTVPCVCSNTIEASCRCFPDLAVDPFDVKGANQKFKELVDDEEKLVDIYRYAYNASGYYSQHECYCRMVEAIENGGSDLKKQWQSIQTRYERRTSDSKPQSYINFAKELASKFMDFVGIPGLVLDIGCGNGKYAGGTYESIGHEYLSRDNTIIGLDPLPSVEDRFPVVDAFGEKIPFQDNIFDGVVIMSVLDHLIDPTPVLEESKRVLKDGGKIFVCNSVQDEIENAHHIHTWNTEGLLDTISSVFDITRYEEVGPKPPYINLFIEGEK